MEVHPRRAKLDAFDDGHGPYMEYDILPIPLPSEPHPYWQDFKEWANDWLGQGYSLACSDGMIIDEITAWAFRAYRAGRKDQILRS
jgi:hypothetical protein